jgi:hypothetical protein
MPRLDTRVDTHVSANRSSAGSVVGMPLPEVRKENIGRKMKRKDQKTNNKLAAHL